jgi:hypothetical protein
MVVPLSFSDEHFSPPIDFGHTELVTVIIEFVTGVSGNLVAAWLLKKFKKKPPVKITNKQKGNTLG